MISAMPPAVRRAIERLMLRLQSVVTRGVVTLVDDKKKVQRFQVDLLADETEDEVEHFQPQGLSFAVEPGAEAVCVAVGGERAHTIAICAQDPSKRPTNAKPGTGGLYTQKQWRLFIDREGVVHVGAEVGDQFIAQAQKTNDVVDETRQRLDDLTTAVNTLRMDFTTFANTHTHMVATAGSPAAQTGTAFPVTAPVPPVAPIQPPLGQSASVAATKGKVT